MILFRLAPCLASQSPELETEDDLYQTALSGEFNFADDGSDELMDPFAAETSGGAERGSENATMSQFAEALLLLQFSPDGLKSVQRIYTERRRRLFASLHMAEYQSGPLPGDIVSVLLMLPTVFQEYRGHVRSQEVLDRLAEMQIAKTMADEYGRLGVSAGEVRLCEISMGLYGLLLVKIRKLSFSYILSSTSDAVDPESFPARVKLLHSLIFNGYMKSDGHVSPVVTPEDFEAFSHHDLQKLRCLAADRLGTPEPPVVFRAVPILIMFDRLTEDMRPFLATLPMDDRMTRLDRVLKTRDVFTGQWERFMVSGHGLEMAIDLRKMYLRELTAWLTSS